MGIGVLVCDEQALTRIGLRTVLADYDDIHVVGDVADPCAAAEAARQLQADIVLVDITMLPPDGIQEAPRRAGLDQLLEWPVIALADDHHDSIDELVAALRAGALGLIRKDVSPPDELVQAIRVIAAGNALVAPPFTKRLLARIASQLPAPPPSLASLTSRERDVLKLIALGNSNAQIANALSLSESTIKCHVSGMLAKLSLRDRAQAVAVAFRAGLLPR
jgi:DNA-binding NarL/FixJ family response regulator